VRASSPEGCHVHWTAALKKQVRLTWAEAKSAPKEREEAVDRRRFLAGAGALPVIATLGKSSAFAEDNLKWAVFVPDNELTFRMVMKPFAETVERETNGAVVFDLFPNGALGRNPAQQPQMILDGVADLAWIIPSYSPGRFSDTEVIELPGVFKSARESTLVAQRLRDRNAFADYGDYYVLGLWGAPPYSIHTNFPVNSVADLKGKKIRVSGKNESAALRALGAVPIGMPITEVAEAVSRGTIGGLATQLSPFSDFGLDRVTNNHFFIRLETVAVAILMNKKKYDSLPQSSRAVIDRNAGAALARKWIDAVTTDNETILNKLKSDPKRKVVFPSQADTDEVEKLFEPIRADWVAASERHKELKAALDVELAAVRASEKD
jgi:TRAP-type transport system periplasmic protein